MSSMILLIAKEKMMIKIKIKTTQMHLQLNRLKKHMKLFTYLNGCFHRIQQNKLFRRRQIIENRFTNLFCRHSKPKVNKLEANSSSRTIGRNFRMLMT
jgi:hypothetical protein